MGIVNKNILMLGIVKFELEANEGNGWIINSVENNANVGLEYLPTSNNAYNLVGDFNCSVEQDIQMNLVTNSVADINKLTYLISTLTLIDTVGSMPSSWNDNKILQNAKKIQNYLLLPSLICNYYANNQNFNSFFFKLLTGCTISPYESGCDTMLNVTLSFTSRFISNSTPEAPAQTGDILTVVT